MITLGIETSCDETALALIETRGSGNAFEYRIIASLVHSQAELHSAYGGVFPSLAKREHGKNLFPLLHQIFEAYKKTATNDMTNRSVDIADPSPLPWKQTLETFRDQLQAQNPDLLESFEHATFLAEKLPIDQIAVTEGPGLEPTLWVGITFARILSSLWNVPVIPVNHMEGHVVGSLLKSDESDGSWHSLKDLPLPAVALLISGGHTELIEVTKAAGNAIVGFSYTILGQTKDDAVGEAFDKTARLLGLPYPGGVHISALSKQAREDKIESPVTLPRPMIKSADLDFSFSGLKTAVLYAVRNASDSEGKTTDTFKQGLAREFEDAVSETLDSKLRKAIDASGAQAVIVGGGVSANDMLRKCFANTTTEYGIPLFLPTKHIAGDNALMIALAGAMDGKTQTPGEIRALGTKRIG